MKFGLSYDDVLLIPDYSDVLPHEIDISVELADGLVLNVPILSAAMDTITESHMATAMALNGGVGVIHRNYSPEAQAREVSHVKEALSWIIHKPMTIFSNATVRHARKIMEERSIGGLPVVEKDSNILKGMVTKKDLVLGHSIANNDRRVSELMSTKIVSYQGDNPSYDTITQLFKESKVGRIPLVDKDYKLVGLVCLHDISKEYFNEYNNMAVDKNKTLIVGAAVSSHGCIERTETMLHAGANFIVIDSAHGDSKNVISAIEALRHTFPSLIIVGGNVATAEGTERLIKAGADIIKVGMGPGSICTTRIVSGMGVPQFTAVKNCAEQAHKMESQ